MSESKHNWWAVVRITGQGIGLLEPGQLETIPDPWRERVHVLELCNTEDGARDALTKYSGEWVDVNGLLEAGGEWWTPVATVGNTLLVKPADRPLPMVELPQETIEQMLEPVDPREWRIIEAGGWAASG